MVGVRNPIPGISYLPQSTLEYYIAEGALDERTIVDVLTETCRRWPERVALSEPGLTVSYAEFDRITDQVAAAMIRLDLKPLDSVIIQAVNCKELLYAFFGCIKAGLIPICTLAVHREVEIGQIGAQTRAKAHIVSLTKKGNDLVEFAASIDKDLPDVERLLVILDNGDDSHGELSLQALWEQEDPAQAKQMVEEVRQTLDPYQVAVYQLSGGTSGTPKIIPRMHNEYWRTTLDVAQYFGFDETLVAFTPNPMLHNMPMACFIMPALMVGGEVAISPHSDIDAIRDIVLQRRPKWCAVTLVHIMRLKEMGYLDDSTFSGAYGFICLERAADFSKIIHAPAYTIFGMTEGLLCFTRHSDPGQAIAETQGRSVSEFDEIRLVHPETERDVEPGMVGELLVRGPCTIRGYFDADEHNSKAFTSDGYYRSGDLMRWRIIDGKRYLIFEGRVKDVVDRGGEKINCGEVEIAINLHAKVEAVMCVAMPDPIYGERMCAFVIPKSGIVSVSVAELADHLEVMGFAKFKFPERVEIVESFPIASNGKPSKPMLRDIIRKILANEAESGVEPETV